MDNIITIELFGQQYSFKAESDASNAHKVVELLMKEVSDAEQTMKRKTPNISNLTVLTSAALNIANDYIDLKHNHIELLKNVSEKSASILKKLDDGLQ